MRLFRKYDKFAEERPFLCTITSLGTIMGLGDVLMQKIEQLQNREQLFSKSRAFFMTIFGSFIYGPFAAVWYVKFLPAVAPMPPGQPSLAQVTKKVVLDETIESWYAHITFLYGMTMLEGGTRQEATAKLKKDFWRIYKADLMVWPFVQFANFYFIPIHLQAVLASVVSVFWAAYLSYV